MSENPQYPKFQPMTREELIKLDNGEIRDEIKSLTYRRNHAKTELKRMVKIEAYHSTIYFAQLILDLGKEIARMHDEIDERNRFMVRMGFKAS